MADPRERDPGRVAREAERGDLRPQFNPLAPLGESPKDLRAVESVLLERFFRLSRPIADASRIPEQDILDIRLDRKPAPRLSDAGCFFYLVETLRRAGSSQVEETLLVILDEFLQLSECSYDEIYLWSIVELSRRDTKYVERFWPAVIALDQRFRHEDWRRPFKSFFTGGRRYLPNGTRVDLPYRMCELLFYFYAIYTIHLKKRPSPPPSLGRCISMISGQLSGEQKQLVAQTLQQMDYVGGRALYGDAKGMLVAVARGMKRF
jgi:hypothetical protein